jgi:hypothetical protein
MPLPRLLPALLAALLPAAALAQTNAWDTHYVPLNALTHKGDNIKSYAPADLNGDGTYEFIVKDQRQQLDPAKSWPTNVNDTIRLRAIRADGTLLWTHDMGWAINPGVWYSPVYVYDADQDGRDEIYCIGVRNWTGPTAPHNRHFGAQTSIPGDERIFKLDPATGAVIAEARWPQRFVEYSGNTNARNQLVVAWLDSGSGRRPHIVALRGKYARKHAIVYDAQLNVVAEWRDTDEPNTWFQQIYNPHAAVSQYFDSSGSVLMAGDLDQDGDDEIVLGSSALKFSRSAGVNRLRGHWAIGGNIDAAYVGDLDWDNPGLEVYIGQERYADRSGLVRADGSYLFNDSAISAGAKIAGDFDGAIPGVEIMSTLRKFYHAEGRLTGKGYGLSENNHHSMALYWTGGPHLSVAGQNGLPGSNTLGHGLTADIMGDWREELISIDETNSRLVIFSPKGGTPLAIPSLRQDRVYRMYMGRGSFGMTGYYHRAQLSRPITDLVTPGQPFAPVVLSRPKPATAFLGNSHTLSVRVAGHPAPTFQWRKGFANIPGATTSSYTIPSVAAGDAGDYNVVVTNSQGSVTTPNATLYVHARPAIAGALARWDFVRSDNRPSTPPAIVAANVTAGPATLAQGIVRPLLGTNEDGATGQRQTSLTLADAIADREYLSFTLTPATGQRLNITAITFRPVSQGATGTPPRKFTLLSSLGGFTPAAALGSVDAPDTLSDAPTLTIPVSGHSSLVGTIEFRLYIHGRDGAFGIVGLGRGEGDDLAVLGTVSNASPAGPPTINTPPADRSVYIGQPVTFSVQAVGEPAPTFQWQKGTTSLPGATSPSFTIPAASLADAGQYRVLVTNSFATVPSPYATLAVTPPPDLEPTLATTTLPPAQVGIEYSTTLVASSGNAPLVWSAQGLPAFLSLASTTGVLSGTPPLSGAFTFTATVTDADGDFSTRPLTVNIAPAPAVGGDGPWLETGGLLVVEAEAGLASANGDNVNWASTTADGVTYMSTGYRASSVAAPAWSAAAELSFPIRIATAGPYSLSVRRRAPDGWTDSAYLGLNDTQIGANQITGVTTQFAWSAPISLGTLPAGDHTLRLRRRESGMELDRLALALDGTDLPAGTTLGPLASSRGGATEPPPEPRGFARWQLLHFTPAELDDEAFAGPLATPLDDGHPNKLKFALASTPWAPITPLAAASPGPDGRPAFTFQRATGQTEHPLRIEVSSDLSSWTDLPSARTETIVSTHPDYEVVRISPSADSPPPRWFVRLRVE